MCVYLLHLDQPMPQGADPRTGRPRAAGHYLGFSENVAERVERHRKGAGARMLEVAHERGITFQKASPRLCPVCKSIKETR